MRSSELLRLSRRLLALAVVLGIYPVGVLVFTWHHVLGSDFKGGRNGPLDAYRHTLASATVSYTLGEWAVDLVTTVFESDLKDSNVMDTHNNRIGASIGSRVDSWWEIEPAVHQAIVNGATEASDPNQITWMPEAKWVEGRFW